MTALQQELGFSRCIVSAMTPVDYRSRSRSCSYPRSLHGSWLHMPYLQWWRHHRWSGKGLTERKRERERERNEIFIIPPRGRDESISWHWCVDARAKRYEHAIPLTAIQLFFRALKSLPTAIPSAAEIDVELCPAPKGSYTDSERFVKPDNPPCCRIVLILSRRPVRILWMYAWCPTSHMILSSGVLKTWWSATVNSTTPRLDPRCPPVLATVCTKSANTQQRERGRERGETQNKTKDMNFIWSRKTVYIAISWKGRDGRSVAFWHQQSTSLHT